MWKQSAGDWQERRHRRHGATTETQPTNPPESVTASEHTARGFLPRGFHDRAPVSVSPAPNGAAMHASHTAYTPLEQYTTACAVAKTWVAVVGAPPDDALDVREFFDGHVGRTVAHHVPTSVDVRPDMLYIRFASPVEAAQAVRTGVFAIHVECGMAAVGIRHIIAPTTALPTRQHCCHLEMVISWCTDQVFLEKREGVRQQLLRTGALHSPQGPVSSCASAAYARSCGTNSTKSSVDRSAGALSPLAPSAAPASMASCENESTAAHPLLPRRCSGQPPRSSCLASSRWTAGSVSRLPTLTDAHPCAESTSSSVPSPPPSTSTLVGPASQSPPRGAGASIPARDPINYYQVGGAYQNEAMFFSDGICSSFTDGRFRTTALSLFLHPCSASCGVWYSIFGYNLLRLPLALLWTLRNIVGALLPSALHRRTGSENGGDSLKSPTPPLLPLSSPWRLRRSIRAEDVVPASASPLEFIAFFLYKYVPFVPEAEEVDVVLWSWLVVRSPYPQRSLQQLKRSLLARQRCAAALTGRQHLNRDSSGAAAKPHLAQVATFGTVDVLGSEPLSKWERQQQAACMCEPTVLMTWRPSWWFAHYSSLSLLVLLLAACCYCACLWE